MPRLDFSGVQQGLSDFGQALGRQRAILAKQQANQAALLADQKLNDKIKELSERKDFSGDWGLTLRQSAHEIATEVSGSIEDAAARAEFETGVLSNVETLVPKFREIQTARMTDAAVAMQTQTDQKALDDAARGDLAPALTALTVSYGADGQTDTAILVSGGAQQAAARRASLYDGVSQNFVQNQLSRALEGGAWSERLDRIKRVSDRLDQDFYGLTPSEAKKAEIKGLVTKALDDAEKLADQEWRDTDIAAVNQATLAATTAYSIAANRGQRSSFQVVSQEGIKALLERKDLHPQAAAILDNTIKTLTVVNELGVNPEAARAAEKTATDALKAKIVWWKGRGVTDQEIKALLDDEIYVDSPTGKVATVTAATWTELQDYIGKTKGLEADPQIGPTYKKILDGPGGARVAALFLGEIGGKGQETDEDSLYRDERGGWNMAAVNKLAEDLVSADREQAFKTLITKTQLGTATPEVVADFLVQAGAGKLAGRFGVDTQAQVGAIYDFLAADLAKQGFSGNALVNGGQPFIDTYGKVGAPFWIDATTKRKIVVDVTGQTQEKAGAVTDPGMARATRKTTPTFTWYYENPNGSREPLRANPATVNFGRK